MKIIQSYRSLLCSTTLIVLTAMPGTGQDVSATTVNANQIEQIVARYILDHPEVVLESVRRFQVREQAAVKQRSRDAVAAHEKELTSDPASPVLGAKTDGAESLTITAFMDYRCGYCKKVADTLLAVANDAGVRVVVKEFPILGPESVLAAKAALAAAKQGNYEKVHRALMRLSQPFTPEAITRIASEVGLDVARLQNDMESAEIQAAISRNQELAGKLGVESTPSFVIGGEVTAGALSTDALRTLIAEARAASKASGSATAGGGI